MSGQAPRPRGLLNVPQSVARGHARGPRCRPPRDSTCRRRHRGAGLPGSSPSPGRASSAKMSGKRDGAVAHVGARPLAGGRLVAAEVEDVVEDLEGEADEAAVPAEAPITSSPAPESSAPSPQAARERSAVLRSQRRMYASRRTVDVVSLVASAAPRPGRDRRRRAEQVDGLGAPRPPRPRSAGEQVVAGRYGHGGPCR